MRMPESEDLPVYNTRDSSPDLGVCMTCMLRRQRSEHALRAQLLAAYA